LGAKWPELLFSGLFQSKYKERAKRETNLWPFKKGDVGQRTPSARKWKKLHKKQAHTRAKPEMKNDKRVWAIGQKKDGRRGNEKTAIGG